MIKNRSRAFLPAALLFLLMQSVGVYAREGQLAQHNSGSENKEVGTSDPSLLTDNAYYSSLMQDLNQAKESIIIIMYLFKVSGHGSALPDHIVDALIKKHGQGVHITVVLNMDQKNAVHGRTDDIMEANLTVAKKLDNKGVKVYFDSPHRITHAKVIIIDKRIVYIGSHNFTQSALRYNHEVSIKIISPAVAQELINYTEVLTHER